MLFALNKHNAHRKVQRSDIIAAWVEERVDTSKIQGPSTLAAKDGWLKRAGRFRFGNLKLPDMGPNKSFVYDGPAGSIGVLSDTLTGYRLVAAQAVDSLISKNPGMVTPQVLGARTQRLMLGGWLDKEDFLTATAIISARARKLSVEPATIDHLITTYGKDATRPRLSRRATLSQSAHLPRFSADSGRGAPLHH
jgi:hypothetical protein